MSRLDDFLENSVIAEALENIKNNKPLDISKIKLTQALQTARMGELFVLDLLESERENDDFFEQYAKSQ